MIMIMSVRTMIMITIIMLEIMPMIMITIETSSGCKKMTDSFLLCQIPLDILARFHCI